MCYECICVCWTTITPFQNVCPTDEQHDRQADSSEGSQTDAGQQAGAKPAEIVQTGQAVRVCGLLLTGLGIKLYSQSCLLCPPYLCHLWLQHQRLRIHPRNVYVDLTVTWERKVLNTHA